MKTIATIISIIFQPLLLPVYAYLLYVLIEHQTTIILRNPIYARLFYTYLIASVILTVIIPAGSMFVMRRSKIISSLSIPDRKERIPVMTLVLVYYIFTYYLFYVGNEGNYQVFGAFMSFLTGGLILSLLSLIITTKWKISIHAIGISGVAGAFMGMTELLYPINNFEEMRVINMTLLILVGVVCAARLVLKAHSISQVLVGIVLGGVVEYVVVSSGFSF